MSRLTAAQAMQTLGQRVAELRRNRGLTQEKLAESIGWPSRKVQRVEAGDANIDVASLVDLANGLDVTLASLLTPPVRTVPPRRPGRPPSGSFSR